MGKTFTTAECIPTTIGAHCGKKNYIHNNNNNKTNNNDSICIIISNIIKFFINWSMHLTRKTVRVKSISNVLTLYTKNKAHSSSRVISAFVTTSSINSLLQFRPNPLYRSFYTSRITTEEKKEQKDEDNGREESSTRKEKKPKSINEESGDDPRVCIFLLPLLCMFRVK